MAGIEGRYLLEEMKMYKPQPASCLCTGVVIPDPPAHAFRPEFLDQFGLPDVHGQDISAPEALAAGSHRKYVMSLMIGSMPTTYRREWM